MNAWIREFRKDLAATRHYFIFTVVLFAAGFVSGYDASGGLQQFLAQALKGMSALAQHLHQMPHTQFVFFIVIFFNNFLKAVMFIFLGVVLALYPLISVLENGMLIGYLLQLQAAEHHNIWILIAKGLLPHGILELPAILLAAAYGIRFGGLALRYLIQLGNPGRKRENGEKLKHLLKMTLPLLAFLWILLLAAAIIESSVTYKLMGN